MADRKHLHFRLLDAGLTYHQAVLFLIAITVVFGFSSLFLQSQQKASCANYIGYHYVCFSCHSGFYL